ncbi:hypothetical protein BCR41DRAFT_110553 [Lobosporangium transversale]|uniref:Uncharacterized protein n=1 Tax=Lobosporangium transversale TaxID=64571 RepID=A0A1Y2GK01_9FUNG|nr:hypothetical protein BCR41DRAFT_110553 [Lobosporangium transversale]ORZ11284.1 hypothetical protein BCR41DRAFT_110553 [Lobosporangium transversale]|eukprot:XP_021879599.1 hypothetical protein BCR41DRAFT_110553 [Lobosporangium transversale]
MRASIEQQTQTSMYSRKDRARQKLNVPISRMPITTQSANTNTGTGTGTGTSASAMIPIQSSTNSTVPSGPFSPITTASITGAVVPGSSPASAGTDDGAAFTYARRWDQTKTMFREDTNKTLNLAQSMTPTKAEGARESNSLAYFRSSTT